MQAMRSTRPSLPSILGRYVGAQIDEIRSDAALRCYGACLALAHVFCFLKFWRQASYFSNEAEAICWPLLEHCFRYRFFDIPQVRGILLAYGTLSALTILLFLPRRRGALAYWALLGVNVFKTLLYAQDYRLRMNQHYMLYWVTAAFLCLPNKRQLLRYTLVSFYVGASILKYNVEWLSGGALHTNPLWIPDALIPASCAYVVVLESFIVWGALSGIRWVYWATLFQLYLFHVVSWPPVGFFYPLLMFALLAIFPLTRLFPRADEPMSLLRALFTGRQPRSTYLFLAAFGVLQLVPAVMPGDEKLTGEGRLFSLHMFDARVYCRGAMTLKFTDGRRQEQPIPPRGLSIRMQCDPALHFSRAKRTCDEHRGDPDFLDLDLVYDARRAHQTTMRPLVNITDFCRQDPAYNVWWPNDWILKE